MGVCMKRDKVKQPKLKLSTKQDFSACILNKLKKANICSYSLYVTLKKQTNLINGKEALKK